MSEKNNLDKYTGILFELKIGLNKDNAIVIDYGGKPVGKIREALKGYPYHGNLCAAVINHANAVGRKLQDDIKQLIQKSLERCFGTIELWILLRDVLQDLIVISGQKDGVIDRCINQTKKKDT